MEQHQLGHVTWVELTDPSDEQIEAVRSRFGLPEFAFDVGMRAHQRPQLERYDGCLLFVLKPATYIDPNEVIDIGQVTVLVGPDTIVTIASGHREQFRQIRHTLEAEPLGLETGPATVVHAILDRLVDGYAVVLDGLDNDVDEIETQVFSPDRGSHAERIYRLKSEVQQFRRAVGPLPDQLDELSAGELTGSFDELGDHLRAMRAKAVRAADRVGHLDELLNSALNAHQAQIAIQQNNDMRRISAWVAIVATPTAIAGIYGMNFQHMPELEWRYGYAAALAVMLSVCVLLYRLFRRSGWL